jgi:hypothetical protein
MARPLKVLLFSDLSFKGIPWSRQHINRKIKDSTFPPPDGRSTDAPMAPRFWFEETIDNYLRERAKKMKAIRTAKQAVDQNAE